MGSTMIDIKDNPHMRYIDIAHLCAAIKAQYQPLAFKCDCLGTHADCREVIANDGFANGQNYAVEQITKFIQGL